MLKKNITICIINNNTSQSDKTNSNPEVQVTGILSKVGSVFYIIYIIGILLAGYLSWSCNTALNENIILKVIYIIFAGLGSWMYVINHWIYAYSACSFVKDNVNKKD